MSVFEYTCIYCQKSSPAIIVGLDVVFKLQNFVCSVFKLFFFLSFSEIISRYKTKIQKDQRGGRMMWKHTGIILTSDYDLFSTDVDYFDSLDLISTAIL